MPASGAPPGSSITAVPGTTATLTVAGVRIDEWSYSLPEDDFVMEKLSFRALWVKVEDTSA